MVTLSRTNVIRSTPQPKLDGPAAGEARRIIVKLQQAGFVAYMAGGCVRDALLGRTPKDYDVATDATPDAVRELFGKRRTLAFGASFGVIGVLPPKSSSGREHDGKAKQRAHAEQRAHAPERGKATEQSEPTEVATFRSDGDYSDGRRPDSVHFGKADQDALRRDFTINGLFYDPLKQQVIDYVGGIDDLGRRVVTTIGNPNDRFDEDKLRMLRAVRFATTLDFTIEPQTMRAIRRHAREIEVVSGERIGAEMRRVLACSDSHQGLKLLVASGLDEVVLPELAGADLEHYAKLIQQDAAPDFPFALACLLTVLPDGAGALGAITRRWKLSNEEARAIKAAITHAGLIVQAGELPWSTVQPILIDRDVDRIVRLAAAIVGGGDDRGVSLARAALRRPPQELNPPPLINGKDLHQLGIQPGPRFKELLQAIRNAQLDQQITTREEAVRWVGGMGGSDDRSH